MTGLEGILLSILEDPDDVSLRLLLADHLEEEHGGNFADFLRSPGQVVIISGGALEVCYRARIPDHLPTCNFFPGADSCLYHIGTLPTKFCPHCLCGKLADEWHQGHWRAYNHPCWVNDADLP